MEVVSERHPEEERGKKTPRTEKARANGVSERERKLKTREREEKRKRESALNDAL